MARYYKLIDAIDTTVPIYLNYMENGIRKGAPMHLVPGVKYSEHADDELSVSVLKNAHRKIVHTPEREAALKACGAKYEMLKACQACGGRRFMNVWYVEVVE